MNGKNGRLGEGCFAFLVLWSTFCGGFVSLSLSFFFFSLSVSLSLSLFSRWNDMIQAFEKGEDENEQKSM